MTNTALVTNSALVTICKLTLAFGLGTLLAGCNQANSEPNDQVIKPVKLYQVPSVSTSGRDAFLAEVDAGERSQLSFQVPGVVDKMQVRQGEKVNKGDILASIDPTDYQLALDAAQAQFELAETRFLRNKKLAEKKLVSQDSLDQFETAYKAAIANLEQAKTDLSYTRIKAPFTGVVSLSFVQAHQFVASKQAVVNILNSEVLDLNIAIPVPYVDAAGVQKLKQVPYQVVFDIRPDLVIPAQFKEMSTQPDMDTNSYKAAISIRRPEGINVLPGMTGLVYLVNAKQRNQLQLPQAAWVYRAGDKGSVWRFDPLTSTVALLELEVNKSGFVVEGLKGGELIVIAGAKDLHEGQVVRAWEREGGI